MTIEAWLIIALIASVILNISLLWLSLKQSTKLLFISESLSDLIQMIESYKNHLRTIYKMEMFYGDENLSHLLEHTKSFIDILEKDYADILDISDPLEIEYEEEEEVAEEINQEEKDVLYAGTRRRNP